MTPDTLNRFVAEKVLGWQFDYLLRHSCYQNHSGKWLYGPSWDPYHSWPDCEAVWEQLRKDKWNVSLMLDASGRNACLMHGYSGPRIGEQFYVTADTITAALVRCVAKAYGLKEDNMKPKQPDKFERMVEREIKKSKVDVLMLSDAEVVKLLRRQHAGFVRLLRASLRKQGDPSKVEQIEYFLEQLKRKRR